MSDITIRPISHRITNFREKAGLSQQKVANILGMGLDTYQKREENADIDCMFIMNMATILGVEIKYLLYENTAPKYDNLYYPIAPCGIFTRNEECFISALRMLPAERKSEIIDITRKSALYPDKSLKEIIESDLSLD